MLLMKFMKEKSEYLEMSNEETGNLDLLFQIEKIIFWTSGLPEGALSKPLCSLLSSLCGRPLCPSVRL